MKLRSVKSMLLVGALAPALGGAMLIGCDDDGGTSTVDAGRDGMGGSGGSAVVPDGGLPDGGSLCTTENVPVTANIAANTTWDCPSYVLKQMTYVTNNAVLTIAPGVKIVADPDAPEPRPGLIVTRGAKLMARGTKEKPIVFTSGAPVGSRVPGDLGGVALLGAARLNRGDACVGGAGATDKVCAAPGYFNDHLEGLDATNPFTNFGGNDDVGSCGELAYVRIEFAGTVLDPNNELNGLTLAGCGSGTKVSYVQVHRGKDDGIEIFGGTANIDHVLVTGDEDDGLDWDLGWRGSAQFVIVHKWDVPAVSADPNAFEGDNVNGGETAMPRSAPKIYNATLIGNTKFWGMTLRRGTQATIRNIVVQGFGGKLANIGWTDPTIVPANEWPSQLSVEHGFFWMNGAYVDASPPMGQTSDDLGFDEKAAFEDPARMNKFDVNPGITSVSETMPNYTPTGAALAGQATPPAGLDVTATYAGAVAPNTPSWTEGWTAYPAK